MTEQERKEIGGMFEEVLFDEPMSAHTSFKIGGNADIMINAHSGQEIKRAFEYAGTHGINVTVMGNGSNMLVSDKGIRGIVIAVGSGMSGVRIEGKEVIAEAGALMSATAKAAAEKSLTGLEFAAGIPGTLGGGIFMNAGAYGGELKDVLKTVTFLDKNHEIKTLPKEELGLSYRRSIFSGGGYVILSCTMELEPGDYDGIKAKMADFQKRRAEKQPLNMPSAGSTFKRPEGYFAGRLIQDAGLMGYSVGGAQVSEKHAGFVVNKGNATAADVIKLIEDVKKTVFEKFGVTLEPEVKILDGGQ